MRPVTETKSALRNQTLKLRNGLGEAERIEMSLQAAELGAQSPEFDTQAMPPGTIVSGFLPIRSEIDARPLMAELARRGARLCLPVVISKTEIEFREMVRGAALVESGFGTVGPDQSAEVLEPQILIMPLSVFDPHGGRIGYGGGFYDRAIEKLRAKNGSVRLIGMGFSLQQVEQVPMEDHDSFLDGIITEAGYQHF